MPSPENLGKNVTIGTFARDILLDQVRKWPRVASFGYGFCVN